MALSHVGTGDLNRTHVCGVENLDYPLQRWVALPLLLLAYQFDVPQLAKVKVPLLLHVLDGRLQNVHLNNIGRTGPKSNLGECRSAAFSPH